MAFTEEYIAPQLWYDFLFFATGGADGDITESIAPGKKFKLTELHIHCSVAFASVQDLTLRLSSIKGSAYNTIFLSAVFNGVIDYFWQPSIPIPFLSDDQVVINLPMVSGTNIIGIKAVGWSVGG